MNAQHRHLDPPLRIYLLLGGLLTVTCSLAYLVSPFFITFLNYNLADAICRRAPATSGSDAVVVVAIDEASLDRLGQWPWPRYRLALLLDKIGQLGAKSIGLDFIMAEPDRLSLNTLLEAIQKDMGQRVEIKAAPDEIKDNDAMLSSVLSKWPCVLGFKFLFGARGGRRFLPAASGENSPAAQNASSGRSRFIASRHRRRLQSCPLFRSRVSLRIS